MRIVIWKNIGVNIKIIERCDKFYEFLLFKTTKVISWREHKPEG